uniref:SGNH hydrolase-type esterase domain-containing protein n=1 Tax=Sander lucioperca TaxID=283035 RepID=A0A8C9YD43_SANLU
MRESLSLQEVELVELKELLLSKQTPTESTQQLRDQISQVRNEMKASIQELRGEVQELQQDREALRTELTALFPGQKVTKIQCPGTDNALQLLTEPIVGQPSHIVIHTGTNDLRLQQERVAESVKRVAQRATQTFPSSKIIISTILPRRDFHPDTIHRINAEISRGCGLMPNVHLAHHPTLNIHSLYDNVHLRKDTVSTFAKTLKDVALGRNQESTLLAQLNTTLSTRGRGATHLPPSP